MCSRVYQPRMFWQTESDFCIKIYNLVSLNEYFGYDFNNSGDILYLDKVFIFSSFVFLRKEVSLEYFYDLKENNNSKFPLRIKLWVH